MFFRTFASAAVTAIWFAMPLACDSPYTYAHCGGTDDCHLGAQNIPGTVCKDNLCTCQDRTYVICCDIRDADDPDCALACRPCWSCPEDTKGCEGKEYECRLPSECPAVPTNCPSSSACEVGRCGYTFVSGDSTSQKVGDCIRQTCDAKGVVTTIVDYSDVHDDGNDCTVDQCDETGPAHKVRADGNRCSSGYCVKGTCVECIYQEHCAATANDVCDANMCVPATCIDNRLGSNETDTDCGGPCTPCDDGQKCKIDADCSSGACKSGRCVAPTASDGRANGGETDVDCGGRDAPACSDGKRCAYHRDCMSGVCIGNVCRAPTCKDGTRNGNEAGIDCGGSCPVACE